MNESQIKEKIKNLLKNTQITVISTVNSDHGEPQSAAMAFAEMDDLSLIFGTSNQTRKYKNLQKNKKVSFVIGWSKETGSVQYEGVARELHDEEVFQYGELLALKSKQSKKLVVLENQKYFLVKPTWIRLIDTSAEISKIYEVSFSK